MCTYYNRATVPDKVDEKADMSCENSFCHKIECPDCINYPTLSMRNLRDTYLMEKLKDEYISEGTERISDGREHDGSGSVD